MVEDILEAAVRALKEHGVERTTTDRIAQRAGVSIGSLYQYFPNKAALYHALIVRHFRRMAAPMARLEERFSELGFQSDIEALPDVLVSIVLTGERVDPELSGALHRLAARYPEVNAVIDASVQHAEDRLMRVLASARGQPGLRPGMDPALSAQVVTRALSGLIRRTLEREPGMIDSEAFAAEMRRLVYRYLFE